MSRELSSAAESDANLGSRREVWLFLVDISHSSLADPIRLCNNEEEVISNESIYQPVGIQVSLPDESADELPSVSLRLSDVDRSILTKLRNIPIQNTLRPEVSIQLVLATSPDAPEAGPFRFELQQHTRDKASLVLNLGTENLLRRAFPGFAVTPDKFANLF